MLLKTKLIKYPLSRFSAICLLALISVETSAQDTSSKFLDLNQSKIVKKINAVLDSTQQKIKNEIYNKANNLNQSINNGLNNTVKSIMPVEEERPLPYEKLLNKKYTLGRRAYQNTVAQYNFLFHADDELNELIQKARNKYQEDYSTLLSFYDYDLSDIAKASIDSIIYRCNANIVLHDLRSNWVDDSYLLLAKAYLFHKNFDTAGSILQFINYSFDEKIDGMDLPIGSNMRQINGRFSIANKETNRIWENENVRNESMVWQARNYLESTAINEGLSLLQLLKGDVLFPKRLQPFLNEQLAYSYYLMESYDNASTHLIEALPNAMDNYAKSRWYYLIAQMYQKANKVEDAYQWYKKANESSPNPIIGVYAKINMVRIQAKKSNQSWELLANDLLQLIRKEKYRPYIDIIYFEMAKLAIQNKAFDKANQWLIISIKSNHANLQQNQQSFELLGEINYQNDNYAIAKIAYDSLNNILKSNPQYETIQLRKKWMSIIQEQTNLYQQEDSLQFIYQLPKEYQQYRAKNYNLRKQANAKNIANLLNENSELVKPSTSAISNNTNSYSVISNNTTADFYFLNTYNLTQGKQQFIQKWGERPNVDMWRRKTSPGIVNASNKMVNTNTLNAKNDSTIKSITKENMRDTSNIILLSTPTDYTNSQAKWNTAALTVAQTFLLKLNDFSKAKPIYQKIIVKNLDSTITERALLDLASEYLHDGKNKSSDSIIQIVTNKFPNGFYLKKKLESENKKNKNNDVINSYNEFYFLSQIGNWPKMSQMVSNLNASIQTTKWFTPYQFLKVKMYAKQNQDNLAFQLLDSIIASNKNDIIKEKASSIRTELINRKNTENYLSNLLILNDSIISDTNKPLQTNESFSHDSAQQHYMTLAVYNTSSNNIDRLQAAIQQYNKNDKGLLNLNVTYTQLDKLLYLIWVGPFDNGNQSIKYLNAIKSKLAAQIIPFIPQQQYEIYIFGKSNISLIQDSKDLKAYREFMINNIYKP
jgi:hypothetical protein